MKGKVYISVVATDMLEGETRSTNSTVENELCGDISRTDHDGY